MAKFWAPFFFWAISCLPYVLSRFMSSHFKRDYLSQELEFITIKLSKFWSNVNQTWEDTILGDRFWCNIKEFCDWIKF